MDDLRREARRLENRLDAKLAHFGNLELSSSHARHSNESAAADIDATLQQLRDVNDAMSRHHAAGGAPVGGTASTMQLLQRHREILTDFSLEYSKLKANLQKSDERQRLLESARDDISHHYDVRASSSDMLLRERNAIHNSERMADDVLSHAEATKMALNAQREVFGGVGSKLQSLASVSPQINSIIAAIQGKRKRDRTILGLVIGICTSLFIVYSVR